MGVVRPLTPGTTSHDGRPPHAGGRPKLTGAKLPGDQKAPRALKPGSDDIPTAKPALLIAKARLSHGPSVFAPRSCIPVSGVHRNAWWLSAPVIKRSGQGGGAGVEMPTTTPALLMPLAELFPEKAGTTKGSALAAAMEKFKKVPNIS